jgi:hypothetical protein
MVYIREAHPTDGWQIGSNVRDRVLFKQPKSVAERTAVAQTMCTKLKIDLPCLLDGLDNKVGKAYSGWPDRLYFVGVDGKIIYKGGPGPRGFRPADLSASIEKYLPTIKATGKKSKHAVRGLAVWTGDGACVPAFVAFGCRNGLKIP